MKIISHRGNISRILPERENTMPYIDEAISLGYDVEVDIWRVNGELFLGHDNPENKVKLQWLEERNQKLWIHTKNLDALNFFVELGNKFMFFYHTKEDFILTSNSLIWAHNYDLVTERSTCVVPFLSMKQLQENSENMNDWYAVCTDFVKHCEKICEVRK